MSIFAWLVTGLIAGWIANMFMRKGEGHVLVDMGIGVAGGLIGGLLMGLLTARDWITGVNAETILISVLGAVLLIVGYRVINPQSARN